MQPTIMKRTMTKSNSNRLWVCGEGKTNHMRDAGRYLSFGLKRISLFLAWCTTLIACGRDATNSAIDTENLLPPVRKTETSILTAHSANPRYFTDSSGNAVYLTGSHTWTNLVDIASNYPPDAFDFGAYLDFLEEKNHNFIRMWTWALTKFSYDGKIHYSEPHPWPRMGPDNALDERPKFDLSQFDTEYFSRLRTRIKSAAERGIYVSIMLFEGHAMRFSEYPWSWQGHPFNPSNNIQGIDGGKENFYVYRSDPNDPIRAAQEAYVRQVINTVNDLENVLYEIGNEVVPVSTDWQYYMIDYIKKCEDGKPLQHPMGMTFQIRGGDNASLFASPADWISTNSIPGVVDYMKDPPEANGSKVIILDTDHLCGISCGKDTYKWIWKSFLRGYNPIYMDPWGDMDNSLVYAQGDEAVRENMGYTLTYANRVNLGAMMPYSDLATTGYCLANPRSEYLICQPKSGSFGATLELGEYHYEWFNPRTGQVVALGRFDVTTKYKSFTPPFGGMAILYLKYL